MNKKELSQLTWLYREIQTDRRQLAVLEATKKRKMAEALFAVPGGRAGADMEITGYESMLEAKIKRAEEECRRLNAYIAGVEDSWMRQILTQRYVYGKTWVKVAAAVGGGNTEDGVRKAHDRYLSRH